jgi:hypothetical protein
MLVATGEVSFASTLITSKSNFYSTEPRCFSPKLGRPPRKTTPEMRPSFQTAIPFEANGGGLGSSAGCGRSKLEDCGPKFSVSAPVFSGIKKR